MKWIQDRGGRRELRHVTPRLPPCLRFRSRCQMWSSLKRLTWRSLSVSGAEASPPLTLGALAALDDCTRPQRLNTSWKQGSRPGPSYFCMPRRVLLALDLGYTPPLDSPPTMTDVKTAYPSSRKRNRKFYRRFFSYISFAKIFHCEFTHITGTGFIYTWAPSIVLFLGSLNVWGLVHTYVVISINTFKR